MSDLNSIIRRLDLKSARKITEEEALTATPPVSKYLTQHGNIRKIEKIPIKFHLVGDNYVGDLIDLFKYRPRCLSTFQCSLANDFYVLKQDSPPIRSPLAIVDVYNAFLTIKFRVGFQVYRYLLAGYVSAQSLTYDHYTFDEVYVNGPPKLNIERVGNHKIGKNFVVEFWLQAIPDNSGPFLNNTQVTMVDITYISSLLINPVTGDDTQFLVEASEPIKIADRSFTLPTPINTEIPNNLWLDNPSYFPH